MRVIFYYGKVQEPKLSIDLEKHVRTNFTDLTGDKFGGVKNGNNSFLDDAAKELDTDFFKDYP